MAQVKKHDFDSGALALAEQHGKDLTDHDDRILSLENKIDTPEHIASLLEFASKDSKKMDKLFASIFVSMLKDDQCNEEVRRAVLEIVQKMDRNIFYTTAKKWSRYVGIGLVYIFGIISPLLLKWIEKRLGL